MSKLRSCTWEIIQNIIAKIVMVLFKAKPIAKYRDATIYTWNQQGGMSLGAHIFVDLETFDETDKTHLDFIKHEYGHTIQSKYLGPLYMFVIAIPSLIWAGCFEEYRRKNKISYYTFYTEKWAEELGEVYRDDVV